MSSTAPTYYDVQIQKPSQWSEFEDLCAVVYGHVLGDQTPKKNGRGGQSQGGVDVFLNTSQGIQAVQCKRQVSITFDQILKEVEKADDSGVDIKHLIVATTADSDAKIVPVVMELSESRSREGKFTVDLHFWSEIQAHIRNHPPLLERYAPNEPGGVIFRLAEQQRIESGINSANAEGIADLRAMMSQLLASTNPAQQEKLKEHLNSLARKQLDSIAALMHDARYRDALDQLVILECAFESLESHSKARWHSLRGGCRLHLEISGAAKDMLQAHAIDPHDEQFIADAANAYFLQSEPAAALQLADAGLERFPNSGPLWAVKMLVKPASTAAVCIDDFPPGVRHLPEVLMALVGAAAKRGDTTEAWEGAKTILDSRSYKPSHKTLAINAGVTYAIAQPMAPTARSVDATVKALLEELATHLEPRDTKLWRNQSEICLPKDAVSLAYIYHLLGRCDDVLVLYDEAASRPDVQSKLWGVKLSALNADGRYAELLSEAKAHVSDLTPASFSYLAEAASLAGDVPFLDTLIDHAQASGLNDDALALRAHRCLALFKADQSDNAKVAALQLIDLGGLTPRVWLTLIRTLIACTDFDTASAQLKLVADNVNEQSPTDIQIELADLHFFLKQPVPAGEIYERFLTTGTFDEIASRLFRCYVMAGMRARARSLLEAMPPEWIDHDETRDTAVSLAGRAGDWGLLKQISRDRLERAPDNIGSWLLALSCERRGGSMARFLELLGKVPERLAGSIDKVTHIARLQIQFGMSQQGMRRLYRMIRSDMQNDDAASAYVTTILGRGEIAEMSAIHDTVVPGTTCVMEADDGDTVIVSIEPDGFDDMPRERKHCQPDQPVALAILGKQVGQHAVIPGPSPSGRKVIITAISPIYQHVFIEARNLATETVGGLPNVRVGKIKNKNGDVDLTSLLEMVGSGAGGAKEVFDAYASQPLTLGMLATHFNTSTLEMVHTWPTDATPLRVRNGSLQESEKAEAIFGSDSLGVCVIDLATLGDMVSQRCEDALATAQVVYLSATAAQTLRRLREPQTGPSPVAALNVVDGKLQVHKHHEAYFSTLRAFLDRVNAALEKYCTVCPAYGTDALPNEFLELDGKLGDDEYEALLLATEKSALLISLDMHLRELAEVCLQLPAVWPQALIEYAANSQVIPYNHCHHAAQMAFRSNRQITPVSAADLLYMFLQGGEVLQSGARKIAAEFSADTTTLDTSITVVEQLIDLIQRYTNSLLVVLEFIEFLYEPLFRHPACPEEFLRYTGSQMRLFSERMRYSPRGARHGEMKRMGDERVHVAEQMMIAAVHAAAERAKKPVQPRPLAIRVIFGPTQPTFELEPAKPVDFVTDKK